MEKKLIDDLFYIEQKNYGLWDSTDKDGTGLVTSLTEQSCIEATHFYLKGRQEGWTQPKTNEDNVGEKL